MTSESYSATDALRMGFVNRLYHDADFWHEVVLLAEQIAKNSPDPLRYAKKIINASEDVGLKSGCVMELGAFSSLFATKEREKKMKYFLEGKKQ
jgi:enoyl-CoA hydratase/carnithine racemase